MGNTVIAAGPNGDPYQNNSVKPVQPPSSNYDTIDGVMYVKGTDAYNQAIAAQTRKNAAATGTALGQGVSAFGAAAGSPLGTAAPPTTGNAATVPSPGISSPALIGLSSAAGVPSTSGGGVSSIQASTGGGNGSTGGFSGVQTLAPVDTSAAQSAAFGAAKDATGQETAGALTGLRSALGGRGMLGSGLEARGTAGVAQQGQAQLGDASRTQATTAADLANANATTNLNAGVTQRGQTMASNTAANSLAEQQAVSGYEGQIAQRGQDITAQSERDRLAMEQAQLVAGQRNSALSGLMSALSPSGATY